MNNKYRSIQFTPNGDAWIFDHESETIEKVWEMVNDQGSKWFFFPIPFVVTVAPTNFKYAKCIDAPMGLEFLKGRTIRTVRDFIKDNQDVITSMIS